MWGELVGIIEILVVGLVEDVRGVLSKVVGVNGLLSNKARITPV